MHDSEFVPRVLESKAKSIDEAIFKGMRELGLSIDEVTIETVQEGTKGILGIGAKPYIVRLTEKDPKALLKEIQESQKKEAELNAKPAARFDSARNSNGQNYDRPRRSNNDNRERRDNRESNRNGVNNYSASSNIGGGNNSVNKSSAVANDRSTPQQSQPRDNTARTAPRDFNQNNSRNNSRPQTTAAQQNNRDNYRDDNRRQNNQNRSYNRDRNDRPYRDRDQQAVSNVAKLVDYTPYVPGESECDGASFLMGLLEHMEISAKLGYYEADGLIKFRIDSETMGILIGHRGETLDAMQYLTSLVVNRGKEAYRRVTLDTENYRSKREETLIRLARKIASQVKASGKAVPLEPMNPYERRVLHAALQRNPYVETHSEGEEPSRYVVVVPKKRRERRDS